MNFSNIKVIVFDLDGTVYEDTHHFDYYAQRIKERLPADKIPLFEQDYSSVKKEEHPLKIGRIFDVEKDLILVQIDNQVQEVYDWEGNKLPSEKVRLLYPEPIVLDFVKMLSVGDPWWIPISIASHYGLDGKQSYAAFLETREYMMGPEFKMEKISGFKEALEELRGKINLALLTNSPQPDSEAILQKLELDNIFSLKIFDGRKPTHTLNRFQQISEHFDASYEEIMSIGDNWINEIRPVKALGCSTIYIDPHGLGEEGYADMVVRSMREVIPVLKKMV